MRRILLCFRRKRRFAGLGMWGGSTEMPLKGSTIPRKAFSPGNRIPVNERSEGVHFVSKQAFPFTKTNPAMPGGV